MISITLRKYFCNNVLNRSSNLTLVNKISKKVQKVRKHLYFEVACLAIEITLLKY